MGLKDKKPGDHVILRLKNAESPVIIDWMNHQSNLSDAIRYLIEEEIKTHEIRDLQEYIPAKRKPLQIPEKKHTVEENRQVQEEEITAAKNPDNELEKPVDDNEMEIPQTEERVEVISSEPEKVSESHSDEKEDDLSDELVDHWMNI